MRHNDLHVGTIVRTPGDYNAFNFDDPYRATGGFPVLSLSFRAAAGGLRNDPKPLAGALPAFFANLLPEDKLREAMEKHHAGNVRAGIANVVGSMWQQSLDHATAGLRVVNPLALNDKFPGQ